MRSKSINILIVLLLSLSAGCDIFTTRDPEDPDSGRSSSLPATTPNQLFENFRLALQDKTVDNYMRLFPDDLSSEIAFEFIPSAGAISKYPSLSQWSLNSERLYFNNVAVATLQGEGILLTQSELNSITTVDSAVYQFDYTLIVPFVEEEITETYKGRAEYIIKLNSSNEWVIAQWEDIEVENYPSWSELKGSFN